MPRTYCQSCEYVYSPEQQKLLAEGKSVRCLCRQDDYGTANELEPSASYPGRGLARHGPSNWTSDYGVIGRGKE